MKSSTEAELVGGDDTIPSVLWVQYFLEEQGYKVTDNIVYQDNQSAILLEKNGQASSGQQTQHFQIRYFYITDRVKNGEVRIVYCPTEAMIADFFTKPWQGSLFWRMRSWIMNAYPKQAEGTSPQECVGTPLWDQVVCDSTKVARGGQEPSSKSGIPHSSQKGVEDRDMDGQDEEEQTDGQASKGHHHTGTTKTR